MKIGGYQLRKVRKRFWVFLGALALVPFLLFTMWPRSAPPGELWVNGQETAFSNAGFSPVAKLRDPAISVEGIFSDERFGNCREGNMQCIYSVQDGLELPDYLQSPAQAGLPFRLRAYIPSQEATSDGADQPLVSERRSLFSEAFSSGGWSFRPAVILPVLGLSEARAAGGGFDPVVLDAQAANALSISEDGAVAPGAVLLGFQGGVPASGAIYDVDAMLFSTSNAIQRPTTPAYLAQPIPTLLVRDFQRVGNEEVLEPASEAADLQITYSAGSRYQLSLHRFEWPADGNARMCITLSNISSRAVPVWEGLFDGMQLRVDGVTLLGAPAEGSRFAAGAETSVMQIGDAISGYIVFGREREGAAGNVGKVSGSPSEQEVRLSITSLISAAGGGGELGAQEAFLGISDGEGGALPFKRILTAEEGFTTPLESSETCSE